jgi:hypothetical protein
MDQVKSLLQTITKCTSEHPYICSFIGISISLVAGYYIYEYVTYIPIVDVLQSSEILIFSHLSRHPEYKFLCNFTKLTNLNTTTLDFMNSVLARISLMKDAISVQAISFEELDLFITSYEQKINILVLARCIRQDEYFYAEMVVKQLYTLYKCYHGITW